jgi:hypothetical protein
MNKRKAPGLVFDVMTDGFHTVERARLTAAATAADLEVFAQWLAAQPVPPLETIHEELARRTREIEARLAVVDPAKNPAITAHVNAIRSKLETARYITTLQQFTPRQVRDELQATEPLFFKIEVLSKLVPMAQLGSKFKNGRKPGTIGPLRQYVRKYMGQHPKATAAEVWAALKAKPPKGIEVCDSARKDLRHVTTAGAAAATSYRQFVNMVSEERPGKAQ